MQVLSELRRFFITVLTTLMAFSPAYAGFFEPSNYNECLSKYPKDTESNRAVHLIAIACKYKYKENVNVEFAECIFDYAPDIVSDRAATIVGNACKFKFIENTNIDLANCLLDEVPEVKTDSAASAVAASCRNRYPYLLFSQ